MTSHGSAWRPDRRELLGTAAVAAASALLADRLAVAATRAPSRTLDFAAAQPGEGWGAAWTTAGVANLRRAGGEGLLEAGTDVFPNDAQPVAFAVDGRMVDGGVRAEIARAGAGAGVVVRRRAHGTYYAAIYDAERGRLVLVRRTPQAREELATTGVLAPAFPLTLELRATGTAPTALAAVLTDAHGTTTRLSARDDDRALQGAGDVGVLATARTLFPSSGPRALPSLGNVHLAPYGVQEGQAVFATPAGAAVLGVIRERSTAAFRAIELLTDERPAPTPASVIASTSGAPVAGGLRLHVATDVRARITVEWSTSPGFERSRRVKAGLTGPYEAATVDLTGLPAGRRVHWRVRARRRRIDTVGPARSFRAMPKAGDPATVRLAIGSCAAQFGGCFDEIAARRPDVFVWQGDLNYPDTIGPLAQTTSGYAGIWRELLAAPRLAPILNRAAFVAQRDDHDYGVQDANMTNLPPFGLAPWDAIMGRETHGHFSAGLVDVWVLNQRHFKTDPTQPDTPEKTLLGVAQRDWLLRTTAASRAPFKLLCSPCTLEPTGQGNARDGSWANGYTAERDLLLAHIAERVSGQTLFLTGDTHFSMVYDRDGVFEARPCPLGIPTPNDLTLTRPTAAAELRAMPGVTYADDAGSHFGWVTVRGEGDLALLDLELVRENGTVAYTKRFTRPR